MGATDLEGRARSQEDEEGAILIYTNYEQAHMQTQAGTDLMMTWAMKQSIAAENPVSGTGPQCRGLIPFSSIVPPSCKESVISPLLNNAIHDFVQTAITCQSVICIYGGPSKAPHLTQGYGKNGESRNFCTSLQEALV